ncbi:MAG: thermonuclease family protein [Nitrososphaerota archaeon]
MKLVKLISILIILACSIYLIMFAITSSIPGAIESTVSNTTEQTTSAPQTEICSGSALCIIGRVTAVIDGDTLEIDGIRIRLALVNTPEKDESGYNEAKEFTKMVCAIGTHAIADQDDGQPYDRYNRVVAKVICEGVNLNAALLENGHAKILTSYCSKSEFRTEWWARKYGCG